MPTVRDQAVCIRHWDWSETSQTVSLFARDTGLLRAVAKGARRESAPFSGGLDVLTRGELVAIVKGGDALAVLTAWDLAETFPRARRSLGAFHAAMALIDLVHHSVRDHDPHPALYDALLTALRHADAGPGNPPESGERAAVLWYLWHVLDQTGHRPEISLDARTGAPLAHAATYAFSPRLGGLIMPAPGARTDEGSWAVRGATVALLRRVAEARSPADLPAVSLDDVTRATRLLALHFREAVGSRPAALDALLGEPVSPRGVTRA